MSARAWALWPFASAVLSLAALLLVLTQHGTPVRPVVLLPYLLLVPGLAAVRFLGIADAAAVLMLAVALSLAFAGALAGAMVYAGAWTPEGGLAVLVVLTLCANAADAARSRRRLRA